MDEPERWKRIRRVWESLRKEHPGTSHDPDGYDDAEVAAMLREIGIALLEVEQTSQFVSELLVRVGAQHTDKTVRVITLPTALMVQVGNVAQEVEGSTRLTTNLDVAGRVEHIANLAAVGAIAPADAIRDIAAARKMPARFGPWTRIVGYAITTVGFGLVINPTWAALPAYVFLGAVVGAIVVATGKLPPLVPVLPTVTAMIVTILATLFVADAANDGLLRIIGPALVAMVPGMSLTLGAMELASSHMVAGASRLIYGVVQLMLLVFGVSLGMSIAGRVPHYEPSPPMGSWSLYVAIVVIAVGLHIILSAPRGSLIWLMAAIAVALIGQKLGGLFVSEAHSGAFGAFLVVPFSMLATRIRTSPPAMVMKVAAFWALVPATLSFISLGRAATGGPTDLNSFTVTVGSIFSIALGMLIGSSVFNAFEGQHWPWHRADPETHRKKVS